MSDCVQETIVKWIATKLEELVTSGDLVAVERPVDGGLPSRPRDKLCALYQDDPEPIEGTQGALYWSMQMAALLVYRQADSSTTPMDTAINNRRATVEKKLMEDATCGGNAHLMTIKGPQTFNVSDAYQGLAVIFTVEFGTRENDPFTQV